MKIGQKRTLPINANRNALHLFFPALLTLVLPACGGGGGDTSSPVSNTSSVNLASQTTSPNPPSIPNAADNGQPSSPDPSSPSSGTSDTPPSNAPPGGSSPLEQTGWKIKVVTPYGYINLSLYYGMDLNDKGDVLGTYGLEPRGVPSYAQRDAIFDTAFGLSSVTPLKYWVEHAVSFNNAGQIVGVGLYSPLQNGIYIPRDAESFLYSDGRYTLLPAGSAQVNNAGQIAGANSTDGPFIYGDGVVKKIPLPSGSTQPSVTAINDSGEVLISALADSQAEHAFLYSNGNTKDLGVLAGTDGCHPTGINNISQVIGYCFSNGKMYWDAGVTNYRPFIYTNGIMKEILAGGGTGWAYSINDRGQIVGDLSMDATSPSYKPFLYQDGKFIDLSSLPDVVASGWKVHSATKINNAGQILGYGTFANPNVDQAFLLTPILSKP